MGDARGLGGDTSGWRRGLRRFACASRAPRSAARCAAADSVSTQSVCARAGHHGQRLFGFSPFPPPPPPLDADGVGGGAKKPARPRPGSLRPPPVASACRLAGQAAAGGPSSRLPPSHFLVSVAVGSSGATPPPPPRSPVSPAASIQGVGGAWSGRPAGRPRPPWGRPGRSSPAPHFGGPGAGLILLPCGGFAAAG